MSHKSVGKTNNTTLIVLFKILNFILAVLLEIALYLSQAQITNDGKYEGQLENGDWECRTMYIRLVWTFGPTIIRNYRSSPIKLFFGRLS